MQFCIAMTVSAVYMTEFLNFSFIRNKPLQKSKKCYDSFCNEERNLESQSGTCYLPSTEPGNFTYYAGSTSPVSYESLSPLQRCGNWVQEKINPAPDHRTRPFSASPCWNSHCFSKSTFRNLEIPEGKKSNPWETTFLIRKTQEKQPLPGPCG